MACLFCVFLSCVLFPSSRLRLILDSLDACIDKYMYIYRASCPTTGPRITSTLHFASSRLISSHLSVPRNTLGIAILSTASLCTKTNPIVRQISPPALPPPTPSTSSTGKPAFGSTTETPVYSPAIDLPSAHYRSVVGHIFPLFFHVPL